MICQTVIERGRGRPPIHWLTPYVATVASTGARLKAGVKNFIESSTREQEPKNLGHLVLLSQVLMLMQRAGLEVEQLGLEPAPIWAASIAGGSLTHYATMPALLSLVRHLAPHLSHLLSPVQVIPTGAQYPAPVVSTPEHLI